MLRFLKGFFGKPIPPDVTPKPEPVAPYKVEAPVLIPQLSVVEEVKAAPVAEPAKLTVDGHGDVQEVKPEAKPKKAPAKKRQFDKKPAAMKASAKPKTKKV